MFLLLCLFFILRFFFFNDPAPTEIYTLSLHDALPISLPGRCNRATSGNARIGMPVPGRQMRSEEHTSELQSPDHLVCRLLLEKKKKKRKNKRRKTCTSHEVSNEAQGSLYRITDTRNTT